MFKKYVAYQGHRFVIEWYFDDRGKSQALEYFENLLLMQKKKLVRLLYLLGDVGKIFNEERFRCEGNKIYVLKPSPDRFLCFFFEGSKVIITNAYAKKSSKMPANEKQRAMKCREDYKVRCGKNAYYD